jgi:hypothetical protein
MILAGKPQVKRSLRSPRRREKDNIKMDFSLIILKWILKKWDGRAWTGIIWLRTTIICWLL